MMYINKTNLPISLEARKYMEDWLETYYDEENTHKAYILRLKNDSSSGNSIWKVMKSKNELRRYLLLEQGFTCCYCGCRIYQKEQIPVEHLKPKSEFKDDIFNYDNLMVSCSGGGSRIIHIVEDETESIETVSSKYEIPVNHIEELYVNDKNFEIVRKEYDLEKLKINDRVLLALPLDKKQRHCDNEKDKLIISIHPQQEDCDSKFSYEYNDLEAFVRSKDKDDEDAKESIKILGLNNNSLINRARKAAIEKALIIRTKIIRLDRAKIPQFLKKSIEYYSNSNTKHAPNSGSPYAEYYKVAFWFVYLAVLKGNTKEVI